MKITATAQVDIEEAIRQICVEHGSQAFPVILDALKRQDDYCDPGAYTNAIHDWVNNNPKEKNSYDPK